MIVTLEAVMQAKSSLLEDGPIEDAVADELIRRQDALQAQSATVLADLDLENLLARYGKVTPVGSAATGLLVQPDIDVCVLCDPWGVDAAFLAARPLASHPRVQKLTFVNEAGAFRPEGLNEGYYWGVRYLGHSGQEWNLDIWFWPHTAPASDIEHAAEIRQRLTPETRLAILWIKDLARSGAFEPRPVPSIDIYTAVLDHGVRTPAAFATYLNA
jgi:hypothetical protein